MRCPNCGSGHYQQYQRPVTRADIVFRRHACLECGQIFASVQAVVSQASAELVELIEEMVRKNER